MKKAPMHSQVSFSTGCATHRAADQLAKCRPLYHKMQDTSSVTVLSVWLEVARKLTPSREILLWMTPSEAPKALQASECSELLDPMRASCWIFAQH